MNSQDNARLRRSILEKLQHGKRNAITGSLLAQALGERDDRRIRVAIRELIAEGISIASSVAEPMGFFIISNEHEAAGYIRVLKERIQQDASRLIDFEKAASSYAIPEQLSLAGIR